MSILLTTPYQTYGEVKITSLRLGVERKHIFVTFQYGDTVGGRWVSSDIIANERLILNKASVIDGEKEIAPADPQYDNLVGAAKPSLTFADKSADKSWAKVTARHSVHGDLDVWVQTSYRATSDNLYQYAIDQGWFAGVIQ